MLVQMVFKTLSKQTVQLLKQHKNHTESSVDVKKALSIV